ncbi:MAG: D-tyrosyl-tRNA(Tyr) deacylase [Clostridia bacterium]|nr:D-tyrosyl-tRNA(Tyr) deacylase [Clostridia bacterium]
MKAVVQRVHGAKCDVDGKTVSQIEKGLVVYVGVFDDDTDEDIAKMARKVAGLRVFTDENGKLAKSVSDVGGSIMLISNFVLAGRVTRGFRPDCTHAAKYETGREYYEKLAALISAAVPTVTGVFGAHMEIEVRNDGPINVVIDTRELRS